MWYPSITRHPPLVFMCWSVVWYPRQPHKVKIMWQVSLKQQQRKENSQHVGSKRILVHVWPLSNFFWMFIISETDESLWTFSQEHFDCLFLLSVNKEALVINGRCRTSSVSVNAGHVRFIVTNERTFLCAQRVVCVPYLATWVPIITSPSFMRTLLNGLERQKKKKKNEDIVIHTISQY